MALTGICEGRPGRSRRRCTYDEVAEWLDRPRAQWPRETEAFADSLELLAEAARRLGRERRERGSLDFDLAEPELILDPEGRVVAIQPGARNRAHRLIEELMVAANRCVAEILMDADQPALYRVHDEPDPARVEELKQAVADLGLQLRGDPKTLQPAALQALLEAADGRPEERLVDMLVLRTLARALYSPEPRGHYALAADAYLHFTSPIRRYPDLLVHRGIRHVLRGGKPRDFGYGRSDMEGLGRHCSHTERRADDATRDAVDWLKCEYMLDKVGEEYEGIVSSVTSFGIFVELKEIYVEGLVHITALQNDYYHFDPAGHRLRGERTGRMYRLGDQVRVRVVRVDLDERKLDFELADTQVAEKPDKSEKRGGRGRKRGKRRSKR